MTHIYILWASLPTTKERIFIMSEFWDDFNTFVGVQGILALIVTLATVIMVVMGKPVPGEMWGVLGVGWGFYFGKNGKMIVSNQKEIKKDNEV